MKKNFVKKLALGLAFTVAVGSVPATNVAAAETYPSFKSVTTKENRKELKVGQTKKYYTKDSEKWALKRINVGNDDVATARFSKTKKFVKVTGVSVGQTQVRAVFKNYKTKEVYKGALLHVDVKAVEQEKEEPVVVAAELASVKQTAANAFVATFTADASKTITKDSFTSIASADKAYTTTAKSVTFSADGLTAEVKTYGNFMDKIVYDVTCAEKTASFTASVGEVTDVIINTVQAQKGVETPIEFTLYDAAGIDVTAAVALNTKVTVDVSGDYSSASITRPTEATITMDTVGSVATIIVTYDALDGVTTVSEKKEITCVDSQVVVGNTQFFTRGLSYSDAANPYPKFYLNSYKPNTTVYMDDGSKKVYFTAVDKNGDAIAYDSYEVETSNDSVLVVSEDSDTKARCGVFMVDPVDVGIAQVIIKATKNDKTYTYAQTVNVKPARLATSIGLSQNSVTISNVSGTAIGGLPYAKHISAFVYDQYGNIMYPESQNITAEVLTDKGTQNNPSDDLQATALGNAHCNIRLSANDGSGNIAIKGAYVVELTGADSYGNEVKKKFTVNVKEPTGTSVNYKLELTNNTIDLNPEKNCWMCNTLPCGHTTTVKLAKYIGGVLAGYVDGPNNNAQVTVKKGNNTHGMSLTTTGSAIDWDNNIGIINPLSADTGVTFNAINDGNTDNEIDPMLNELAQTGTYTVVARYTDNGKVETKSATFKVVNTQEMPTVEVSTTKVESLVNSDIIKEALFTDVDMLLDDNVTKSIRELYKYTASTDTYAVAAPDNNNKVTINRVAVEDTFNGFIYIYYVPVTRTFVQD